MGEELTRNVERSSEPVKGSPVPRPAAPAQRTGADRPLAAPRNSSSADPGTGRTPAAGGTGNGAAARTPEKEQGKKAAGLAVLNSEIPAPAEPKKQGKRKPSKKKKPEPQAATAEQIAALIVSTSAIIGSRPGMEVFTLRPEEGMQLATPIANMIAKSEKLQNLGEHADAIALVTASLVIFAPRFIVYTDQQKQKKNKNSGGVKLVRTDGKKPKAAEGSGNDRKPDAVSPAHVPDNASGIYDAIPSTIF